MKYPKILIAIVVIAIALYLFGVIYIDMDPQGNLSAGLNNEENSSQNESQSLNEDEESDYINDYYYDGPRLKAQDYSKMDFFDDGYEIVKIDKCVDGDTAQFILDGNRVYKTRFLAIDTPEKHEDNREKEPWGVSSSEFTYDKIMNANEIILQSDPDSDELDKYGRLLAWVWVDGHLLNYMIVDASLAEVDYLYGDYLYTDALLNAERIRQKEGKKIWGEIDPRFDYDD